MQYDNMQNYYAFYIKGLYQEGGWRKIYAGDDPKRAREIYHNAIKNREHTKLRQIVTYHKGSALTSHSKTFI